MITLSSYWCFYRRALEELQSLQYYTDRGEVTQKKLGGASLTVGMEFSSLTFSVNSRCSCFSPSFANLLSDSILNSGSSLVRKLKVTWDIWMTMVTSTTSTCTSGPQPSLRKLNKLILEFLRGFETIDAFHPSLFYSIF